MTPPSIHLTQEQLAVVKHDYGPALVFAVAGAGKTTAMEHRIARLVKEKIFAPPQILATAYNRSAANELKTRLQRWEGCHAVAATTLHALGFNIIRNAFAKGYLPYLNQKTFAHIGDSSERLLNQTLQMARKRQLAYAKELDNLDREDFLTYLSLCKGQLAYASLEQTLLPKDAQAVATQASTPEYTPWYPLLYRLYEEIRISQGTLTFDDMLMTGWEMLVQHEELLVETQQRYQAVLVDEFQDVNLAQSEILDLITQGHRNYMAIGDDDQTIYEWRGADARFILNFKKRYTANSFVMSENFRCKAGQIALANRVIQYNLNRAPKRLQLTQGFEGVTMVHEARDAMQMGSHIAHMIQAAVAEGYKLTEITILVRVYAQTAAIEPALILANIPYEIVGDVPFYDRPEVQALVNYCRLAYLERLLTAGKGLTEEQAAQFWQSWNQVYWQPNRYIAKELSRQIGEAVTRGRQSICQALRFHTTDAYPSVAEKMEKLADDLAWLVEALPAGRHAEEPAARILQQLEERLGYNRYLEKRSGSSETGIAKAETVNAFIDYAQNRGNLQTFLIHIRELSEKKVAVRKVSATEKKTQRPEDILTITSIYRAKGSEWPVVFIPHCNEDVIPHKKSSNHEEERRLLYVAITRAKEHLHLLYVNDEPISPFLHQANFKHVLQMEASLRGAIHKSIDQWQAEDIRAIATYACQLDFQGYFTHWWHVPIEDKQHIATLAARFYATIPNPQILKALHLKSDYAKMWSTLAGPDANLSPLKMPELDRLFDQVAAQITKRKIAKERRAKRKALKQGRHTRIVEEKPGKRRVMLSKPV